MTGHRMLLPLAVALLILPAGIAKAGKDIRETVLERQRAPQPPSPDEIAAAYAVVRRAGDVIRRGNADAQVCGQAISADPQYAPLLPYHLMGRWTHTAQELSNTNSASDAEIRALRFAAPKVADCRATSLAPLREMLPTVAKFYEEEETTHKKNLADLMERKTSWGQYLTATSVEIATYARLARDERIRVLNLYSQGAEAIPDDPGATGK